MKTHTDINDALEYWTVDHPLAWKNDTGPDGWWAVSNADEGIIAYFYREADAFRYRLAMINRDLNP